MLLIQCNKQGIPYTDFCYKAKEAIEFRQWYQASDPNYSDHYVLSTLKDLDQFDKHSFASYTPVGTVEFVHKVMKIRGIPIPKPINVPENLFPYAGRKITNGGIETIDQFPTGAYVKSNDRIKSPINDFYNDWNGWDLSAAKGHNCQFSEIVSDVVSEHRVFVFNGTVRGVGSYDYTNLFNPTQGLDKDFIEDVVKEYKKAPIAYTLDIGVKKGGENFVMEVHNFYSCGLYGWDNPEDYYNMLLGWWKEYVRSCNA